LIEDFGKRQMEVGCYEFQYGRGTLVVLHGRA
jgi:hypothetical protein